MFAIRPASKDRFCLHLRLVDVLIALLAPIAAIWLGSPDPAVFFYPAILMYVAVGALATIANLVLRRIGSIVARYLSACDAVCLVNTAILSVVMTAAITFMVNRGEGVARTLPVLHFLTLSFGLLGSRVIGRAWSNRQSPLQRRTGRRENMLVIGANDLGLTFIRMSALHPGRRILAILDSDAKLHGRSVIGCPVLDEPAGIDAVITEYAVHGVTVDKLFLALSPSELTPGEVRAIRVAAAKFNCETLDRHSIFQEARRESEASSLYAPEDYQLVETIRARSIWAFKRVVDSALALAIGLVAAPVFLLCSPVIIGELGWPALFWQERLGRDGLPIQVVKFRTMAAGAATPSSFGARLRRLRVDELPQLLNVLRGEMALVGPRPLLEKEQNGSIGLRLATLPGLTGWAQVCGANLCSMEEKVALDEWYVQNASFRLDLKIMLMTINVVLGGEVRREADIAVAIADRARRLKKSYYQTAGVEVGGLVALAS